MDRAVAIEYASTGSSSSRNAHGVSVSNNSDCKMGVAAAARDATRAALALVALGVVGALSSVSSDSIIPRNRS